MILVTGASGFLGQHLLLHLLQYQQPIIALYRTAIPTHQALLSSPLIQWKQCNLCDYEAVTNSLKNATQVYHCANEVSFETTRKNNLIYNNVTSTANVVNACLENKVQKLLHVSSVAALGRANPDEYINENTLWENSTHNSQYALSKHLAELEVWRGIAEGLQAVIVNPSILLGEGNWNKGSTQLFKTVYNEFKYYTQGTNGWVDVKDVVRAMYLLMQSNQHAERFIISEGNYGYKEIFTQMAIQFKKKPPSILASNVMSNIVWRMQYVLFLLAGKKPSVTRETANTAQLKIQYDNSLFLNTFPEFSYTLITETIQRVCTYLTNEMNMIK